MSVNRFQLVKVAITALAIAPALSGCGGTLSDYSIKDQEWFQRPGRIFGTKTLTLETPPLSVESTVSPNDLITADGACPGMAPVGPPSDANALQDAGQPAAAPQPTGTVALGHIECDVARAAGRPDSVSISANPRGDRVAVLTYLQGPRPGIYTFTSGRLTAIDRVDQPAPVKPAKPAKKKHAAG